MYGTDITVQASLQARGLPCFISQLQTDDIQGEGCKMSKSVLGKKMEQHNMM